MLEGAFGIQDSEYYFWVDGKFKRFTPNGESSQYEDIPYKVITNEDACILFFRPQLWFLKENFDVKKIVVSRNNDDWSDPVKAFYAAYFLAKSGLSRTKANKFIDAILEDYNKSKKSKWLVIWFLILSLANNTKMYSQHTII